jgi:very-short-patch-repair endonuclease
MRLHTIDQRREFADVQAGRMIESGTIAENAAWEFLAPMGFDRQIPIDGHTKNGGYWIYVCDFYHQKLKLCIEVDGGVHKRTKGRDRRRATRMAIEGIVTLRFTNKQVVKTPDAVKAKVKSAMAELRQEAEG